MSRVVSMTMRQAMNAQETGEIMVGLLTITHPSFPTPLLLSSDPTERLSDEPLTYGTSSRGDTYTFCPMVVSLPDDLGERAPTARLMIENVSRQIVEKIRGIANPGLGKLELVLASSPDDVEIGYPDFEIVRAQYNANVITLELSIDALTDEPYPAETFNPSGFPGLF
ncbi:DUF1833 family protein [Aminobacter carboxidus]|uniref:DUF1833 family protein n=1 Tax=Aminobacter carboxidus TaxID=376165 RepID=A0ABR9GX65_9HYPH|nr:DUF1833 family protein [Aminobacter carboxidus]MBE1208103.1 DUF1833 family protein [Aminobacter carboxidus]